MAHSTTLIPLSPSTSHSSRSSLTSEESEFDHTALPTDTQAGFTKAPTLGVRELASMALSFPKPKVMAPQLSSEIALLKALGPQPDSAPFTREVEIKGWKIVGGKSWTDRAKVGAYVGKLAHVLSVWIRRPIGGQCTISKSRFELYVQSQQVCLGSSRIGRHYTRPSKVYRFR